MRGNLYRLPLAVVAEASSARSQLAWSDTSAPLRRSRAAFGRCRLMLRTADRDSPNPSPQQTALLHEKAGTNKVGAL
jgi:hypothetical protein